MRLQLNLDEVRRLSTARLAGLLNVPARPASLAARRAKQARNKQNRTVRAGINQERGRIAAPEYHARIAAISSGGQA